MKSFKLLCIFGLVIILLQFYRCSYCSNNFFYYLECGQALIDQDKVFYKKINATEVKKSFKYTCSINIIEKYITIFMIFYIMNFYIKRFDNPTIFEAKYRCINEEEIK